ncbi:hypothetical protein CORC01_11173 [Colletotrichum orchidophilum]|uniref:Uncharacterized protein n=1 Tax=Colletotrichum orchidophilum TaxID=1209926 RepID=A0A1G4AWH6_9PEZI|nr:uncharacterized protein CORC01_11173 [Colletotrichum orchidophilum]OHE93487.1 hypothetical protein CORC01_11173 [Colletotrichum orchidophilum]
MSFGAHFAFCPPSVEYKLCLVGAIRKALYGGGAVRDNFLVVGSWFRQNPPAVNGAIDNLLMSNLFAEHDPPILPLLNR